MEDFIKEVEHEVEHFTHKPGGIIDQHLKHQAQREAAAAEQQNIDHGINEPAYKAVKVAPQSPEIFVPQTFSLGPGNRIAVLPYSQYRSRATILCITSNATVILCKDEGAALSQSGFTLPYGVPIPVTSRAPLWAVNNTAGVVQVSVLVENYGAQ